MESIEIMYRTSEKYAEMTCVSVASVMANTKRNVRVHIFEHELTNDTKERILQLEKMYPHGRIEFHHISNDEAALIRRTVPDETLERWTITEFFNAFMMNHLKGISKVISFGSDIVVDSDLSAFYDLDISNNYAIAHDYAPMLRYLFKYPPHYDSPRSAINLFLMEMFVSHIGIDEMIYNLDELRKNGVFDDFLEDKYPRYINEVKRAFETAEHYFPHLFKKTGSASCPFPSFFSAEMFQSSLFEKKVILMPEEFCCPPPLCYEFVSNSQYKPVIYHMFGLNKPAFIGQNDIILPYNYELYFKYKRMSPYADDVGDKRLLDEYKNRINAIMSVIRSAKHKLPAELQMHYDKEKLLEAFLYDNVKQAAEKVKQSGKKLALWGKGRHSCHIGIMLAILDVRIDLVVNGIESNWGGIDFGLKINSPDVLVNKSEEYIIIIAVEKPEAQNEIQSKLLEIGFNKQDIFIPLDIDNGI